MELTKEQQDFLNTEGRIVLCAVPGSGKTFIVAKKLISYLKEWKYLHRGVAALSFTNVASDEIKRQITDSSQKPVKWVILTLLEHWTVLSTILFFCDLVT